MRFYGYIYARIGKLKINARMYTINISTKKLTFSLPTSASVSVRLGVDAFYTGIGTLFSIDLPIKDGLIVEGSYVLSVNGVDTLLPFSYPTEKPSIVWVVDGLTSTLSVSDTTAYTGVKSNESLVCTPPSPLTQKSGTSSVSYPPNIYSGTWSVARTVTLSYNAGNGLTIVNPISSTYTYKVPFIDANTLLDSAATFIQEFVNNGSRQAEVPDILKVTAYGYGFEHWINFGDAAKAYGFLLKMGDIVGLTYDVQELIPFVDASGIVRDYNLIENKPKINGVTLAGDKSSSDLGLQPAGSYLTVETDPTVSAWAKQPSKPTYTADEIAETNRIWLTTALKPLYDAAYSWVNSNGSNVLNHINNAIPNPHNITPELINAINVSEKGAALGVTPLDAGGKVALQYLPSTLLVYKGTWVASTNTPNLPQTDISRAGHVYIVTGATATVYGIEFKAGDWAIYNDQGVLQVSDNSDEVISVNGYRGVVVLTKADVGLGNVDNTSDINKPISNPTKAYVDNEISKLPYYSAGSTSIPSIVDNGNGSVTIGTADYNFFDNVNGDGFLKHFTVSGNTFTLVDNQQNYIVANYNGGSPLIQQTTDVSIINETTIVPIYSIFRNGNFLHLQNWDSLGNALANKIHQSIVKTQRYRRESGLSISSIGTRNIFLSSGRVYVGAVPVDLLTINTQTGDPIFFYYQTTGGAWTSQVVSQYNNTQYNNGTSLVTLTSNRYAVNWIFRGVESNKHLYMVVGVGDYTLTQAENATVPPVPPIISAHTTLVGKIIVQRDSDTPNAVISAFDVAFAYTSNPIHNDLGGIDGGDATYKGHLSTNQNTAVTQLTADWEAGKRLSTNDFTNDYKNNGLVGTGNSTLTTLKQVADYAEIVGYNKIIDLSYTISTSGTVQVNIANDSKGNLLSTYGLRKISLYCYLETNATATGKRLGISVNNVLTSTYKQTTSLAAYMLSRIGASGVYRIDLEIIGGVLAYRVVGDQSSTKVNDSTFVNVTMVNGINTSISAINSIQLFVLASESTEFNGQIKILGIYE